MFLIIFRNIKINVYIDTTDGDRSHEQNTYAFMYTREREIERERKKEAMKTFIYDIK